MKLRKSAFTLVELIVVTTILAILWTIWFVSFQWYSTSARDSVRVSDLKTISRALEYYKIDQWAYPTPTDNFEISYSGSLAWKQWVFGEDTRVLISSMSETPTDPLTKNPYTYSITNTRQEYEIWSIMERPLKSELLSDAHDNNVFYTNIVWTYNKQIITVRQNDFIYILWVPTIITWEIESVDIDTILTNQSFAVRNSSNLPSSYATVLPEWQSHTWSVSFTAWVIPWLTAPLLFQWWESLLANDSQKQTLWENIKQYFLSSNISNSPSYDSVRSIVWWEESEYIDKLIISGILDIDNVSPSVVSVSWGWWESFSGPFVSNWDTSNAWVWTSSQIVLPLDSSWTFNFEIDWWDGTSDTITTYDQAEATHTYAAAGTYTLTMSWQLDGISFDEQSSSNRKLVEVTDWWNAKIADGGWQFRWTNFTTPSAIAPDLSLVTDANRMFENAILWSNINTWNFSNVINANRMFYLSDINASISNIIFSWISNTFEMFNGADINANLVSWDIWSTLDGTRMFNGANINADISWIDLSGIQNATNMFDTTDIDFALSNLDFSSVSNAYRMFYQANINEDLTNWDFENLTSSSRMFENTNINWIISWWDVSAASDANLMFHRAIIDSDVTWLDLSWVWNASGLFNGATINTDIASLDLSNAFNVSSMFSDTNINVSVTNMDLSSATGAYRLFYQTDITNSITNLDLSSVTYVREMFNGTSIDATISWWNLSSLRDAEYMFYNTDINTDITGIDFSGITEARNMFDRADFNIALTDLDLSGVTDAYRMFYFADIINAITNLDLSSANYVREMFNRANINANLSWWDMNTLTDGTYMYYDANINADITWVSMSSLQNATRMFQRADFTSSIAWMNVSNINNMTSMFDTSNIDEDISWWSVAWVTSCNWFDDATSAWWTAWEKPNFTNCTP